MGKSMKYSDYVDDAVTQVVKQTAASVEVGTASGPTYSSGSSSWHGKGGGGSSHYSSGSSSYTTYTNWKKCKHTAVKPVTIGKYTDQVYLGARWDIDPHTVENVHLICPLNGDMPKGARFGTILPIIQCELADRGGVPANWGTFIKEIVRMLDKGYKILAYCTGSHGRTGVFGASLISVLEPEVEDPIAAIRERHCHEAVESLAQARAVFALRGQELPAHYEKEFKTYVSSFSQPSKSFTSTPSTAKSTTADNNWQKKVYGAGSSSSAAESLPPITAESSGNDDKIVDTRGWSEEDWRNWETMG